MSRSTSNLCRHNACTASLLWPTSLLATNLLAIVEEQLCYKAKQSTYTHDTAFAQLLTLVDLQTGEDLLLQLASGRYCHCQ